MKLLYGDPVRAAVLVTERYIETRPRQVCPLCLRSIRAGQYVLRLKGNTNIHASCLKVWVADVPEDEVEPAAINAEFERIKRELATA